MFIPHECLQVIAVKHLHDKDKLEFKCKYNIFGAQNYIFVY